MLASPDSPDDCVLLLGTSPLMMIQALHFHHQGRRVALLERQSHVGGSWYTRDLWGLKNLEFSVHELLGRPRAYRFVRESLGLELAAEADAYGRWNERRLLLPRYRLTVRARSLPQYLREGRWRELWNQREETWRDLRFAGVLPHYPVGGAKNLLARLRDMLGRAGVPIYFGTTAREVDLAADLRGGVCRTAEREIRFSRFVMGQSAHCPIQIDGAPFAFDTVPRSVTTMSLHVEGEGLDLPPFMTWRDHGLRRFRDISPFVDPPLPAGQLMLALALRPSAFAGRGAPEPTGQVLLDMLIALGVVAPGARLLNHHLESYALDQIGKTEIRRIARRLAPAVLAMETWDLAECLETRLRDPRVLSLPPYDA
jgi:hypothetical protein